MLNMLVTFTIIIVSLPFIAYLLNSLSYSSHYEALSVNQFYLFLQDELKRASNVEVNNQSISYKLENDDIATISQYNKLIRRQVQKKGHEIYLRDVEQLTFKTFPYGIRTTIITCQGEKYEKTIFTYK